MSRGAVRSRATALLGATALLLGLVAVTSTAVVAPAAAAETSLKLDFYSGVAGAVSKGTKIADGLKYQFLIQRETTGLASDSAYNCLPPKAGGSHDPAYPNNCQWPGTRTSNTGDPVVASGDQGNIDAGDITLSTLRDTCLTPEATANRTAQSPAPSCRFLVSIKADGYEIGGAHFSLPTSGAATLNGPLPVTLLQYPLPLATIRVRIFKDTVPADGVYEIDAEQPIAGFRAYLNDMLGDVSTDYYGNPICTEYETDPATGEVNVDADGTPIIKAGSTGQCISNAEGDVVIPNMAPGRYGIVIRQSADKRSWLQTTTLEGAQDHDWWVMAGDTGFGTETTSGGELVPEVQFGFVPPEPTIAHSWLSYNTATNKDVFNATGADADSSAVSAISTAAQPGGIEGSVHEGCTYIASVGGAYVPNSVPGANGTQDCGPISKPLIAISALDAGDQVVWAGSGAADGTYSVPGLANGNYMVTVWDAPVNHILETFNVTVTDDQMVNAGVTYLSPWFTHITGSVFVDTNGNGRRDVGEQGVIRTNVAYRERDNTPFDQFTNSINTDAQGNYDIKQAYPLSRFTILEHANPRFKPTGITVQACNDPKSHTYLGGAVDISVLPVIGLCGRVDWAVQPYASGETGGIVGTITYGTTRNETDPADAATESWQPGIQNVPVNLYAAVICGTRQATNPDYAASAASCTADRVAAGEPMLDANGAAVRGPVLADTYTSESYERPQGCVALDRTGAVLKGEKVLADPNAVADPHAVVPPGTEPKRTDCVEAPMAGFLAKPSDPTPGASAQTVNGNYGFATSIRNLYDVSETPACTRAQMTTIRATGVYPLPACTPTISEGRVPIAQYALLSTYGLPEQVLKPDSYLVGVEVPKDAFNKDMYKITSEADVNIFGGDDMVPQGGIKSAPGGVTTPDCGVKYGKPACTGTAVGLGVLSACVGAAHTVTVTNPDFLAGGGSPYEGMSRQSCSDKLVQVVNATQQVTNFELFTDVPLAAHFWGLILNDLGVSSDPTKIQYGEVEGLPNAPTGIYDWAGNLVDTAIADPNGFYEAIEPSTTRINNPSPTGVSPGMYRFVGNDPGTLGHLNPTYDSRYRTIATNFQAWPGLWTVTDTAPTLTAAQTFNGQMTAVKCLVSTKEPQVFAVDNPVVKSAEGRTLEISGRDFGATRGTGAVLLGAPHDTAVDPTTARSLRVASTDWTDTTIRVAVPAGTAPGPRQLLVRAANGKVSATGITIHVTGAGYDPTVLTVGPNSATTTYDYDTSNPLFWDTTNPASPAYVGHPLQDALDHAAELEAAQPDKKLDVVVVAYPQAQVDSPIPNPTGSYFENVIVHSGVKLQGVGPGGFHADGSYVRGSIIDGSNFAEGSPSGDSWLAKVSTLDFVNSAIAPPDSATVTVLSAAYQPGDTGATRSGTSPAIDGFTITGGIQSTTPTNINILTGGSKTPYGVTGAVITQGGGVYVHGGSDGLVVSNNKIDGNSGSYAGGIRVGTPYANNTDTSTPGIADDSLSLTDTATTPSTGYTLVNQNLTVAHNTISNNGGANLAGGVGIFTGTVGYRVAYNDVCGNFSAEYGGGISHYGFSRKGHIDHNRVWFNESYDEGGGILVAGEVPATPDRLSGGAGDVTIDSNRIDQNLSNDDGGGLRLLNAGVRDIKVENNEIVDNVSAHEGGGIALNDASSVTIDNNTVARNVTTATAVTSDGTAAASGLATSRLSQLMKGLLTALGRPAPLSTDPVAFNNVFWDNRAGAFDGLTISGIADGTGANAPTVIDIGSTDASDPVDLHHSVITDTLAPGVVATGDNTSADPRFKTPFTVSVHADARRSFTAFRQTVITDMTVSPWNVSDYSLAPAVGAAGATSSAVDWGTAVGAPALDLTGFTRFGQPDAGAFELRTGTLRIPGAPTITSISRVAGSSTALDVRWTSAAPIGVPVTFVVQAYTPAGSTVPTGTSCAPVVSAAQVSRTCRVTGLVPGTTYEFDVTASDAAGSSVSPRVTGVPVGAPLAPTGVTLSTGPARALVAAWSPLLTPLETGGAAISSYRVQLTAQIGTGRPITWVTDTTTAASYQFAGLLQTVNGTPVTYSVQVRARNRAGFTGPWSAASPFVQPSLVAGAVAIIPTIGARGTITVAWAPPKTKAMSGKRYTVRVYPSRTSYRVLTNCTASAKASLCTVAHLLSQHSYYVSVVPTGAVWRVIKTAPRTQGHSR
jgi:hypothetical protein